MNPPPGAGVASEKASATRKRSQSSLSCTRQFVCVVPCVAANAAAADAVSIARGAGIGSSTVGSAVRSLFRKSRAEASRELIKYNRIAADILKHWDVVRGEWVPLLPFAMKIGSDLYHPAHGGDERARSGSYTRAVNGCFDPTAGGEKKE